MIISSSSYINTLLYYLTSTSCAILSLLLIGICPNSIESRIHEVATFGGSIAYLPCEVDFANCGEIYLITWYKNVSNDWEHVFSYSKGFQKPVGLFSGSPERISMDDSNMTTTGIAYLKIKNVKSIDEGNYKCEVNYHQNAPKSTTISSVPPLSSLKSSTNACPSTTVSKLFTLGPIDHLRPPRITEHPSDTVVALNEPTKLDCRAEGNPSPTIEWYKDGKEIGKHHNRMVLPTGSLFFLHVIHNKKDPDTGTYWCVARNEIGKATSRNATLNYAFLREEFKTVPKSQAIVSGDPVTLECIPPRGYPEPRVYWAKDGRPVSLPTNRIKILPDGSLRIIDVRPSDAGRYTCIAENSIGTRESASAILEVSYISVKPYFILNPENVSASFGESVEFSCKVGGEPAPYITWTKKDGKIATGRSTIKADKTLRLVNVTLEDEGVYICEAGNLYGSAKAYATLSVNNYGTVGGGVESSPALYHSIAKEPYFIVGAILLMFLLCSVIMIVFARQHLGWKKAVGAYITVQLSKADELEKARHLNTTCSSKNSWLLETTTGTTTVTTTTATSTQPSKKTTKASQLLGNKSFISSELRKGSSYHQHSSPTPPPPLPPPLPLPLTSSNSSSSIRLVGSSIRDDTGKGYRKGGPGIVSSEIKPFNPSHHYHDHLTTNLQSYPSIEEGYYAEVEGYSSLVTFGKKDSASANIGPNNQTIIASNLSPSSSLTSSSTATATATSTAKSTSHLIEPLAPSIEPYATTNLINTNNIYHHLSSSANHQLHLPKQQYHESSIGEHRACDQNNYHHHQQQHSLFPNHQSTSYYGLPLTVSITGSTGNVNLGTSSPSLSRYPQYQSHINNYNHNYSPCSSNRSTTTTSNTSSTSTPNTGLGYRKVILKDERSNDNKLAKNKRTVLITDDLYAIPNCGPDEDDEEEEDDDDDDSIDDIDHIRPPSANFFLPNT